MVPWLAYPACTILKFDKLLPCENNYIKVNTSLWPNN